MNIEKIVKCFSSNKLKEGDDPLLWLYHIGIFDPFYKGQPDEELQAEKHDIEILLDGVKGFSWRNQGLKDENRHKVMWLRTIPIIREKLEKGSGLKKEEKIVIPDGILPKGWEKAKEPTQVGFTVSTPEQKPKE